MRVPMRRLLPNSPNPTRRRVARSLTSGLVGAGVALSLCAAVLGALSLAAPFQLARDLDQLEEAAGHVVEAERFASLAYGVLAEDATTLERGASPGRDALREELRGRAHALLVSDDASRIASIDAETRRSWLELLEALDRERRAGIPASIPAVDTARRERLELLAVARLDERIARLHGDEVSRLEYLASRVSLAADHPLLAFATGGAMRTHGIARLFGAIAAERAAATLRFERWQRAIGRPVDPGPLERRARELTRFLPRQQEDAPLPVAEFAAALSAQRKAQRTAPESFEAHWLPLLERESDRAFEVFVSRADALATAVRVLGALLLLLTLGSLAIAALLPAYVRRCIAEPLGMLPDLVRDPDTTVPASARHWVELNLIRETVRSHAERTRETERRSIELAFYDSTTGVANRRFFSERLSNAIVAAKRDDRQLALIAICLDELSSGSDHLSREETDTILRQAASRLHDVVRLSDLVGNQESAVQQAGISRTAEAEFALLVSNVGDPQDAARVADRALAGFARPFEVDGRSITLQCNLGLAIFPGDAPTGDELLRNAQIALRHAQQRGSNQYQFFSSHLNDVAARRFHVRNRLSGALERGDLSVLYQPVRDTESGRVTCAEVLMRWSDEEMGPVSPSEFITVAEQTGLVSSLGRWALEQACLQHRAWVENGFEPIRIAVNVSPVQFADADWPEVVQGILERTGMDPDKLDLEITETALLQEGPATVETFERLVELGVGLVVDDFGTGFSSISYLHRYPIDRIKIDRSFVSDIGEDGRGAGISNAILAMAESLGLGVVAEGVETEEQARHLVERGCREIQGYLISQAVTAEEFVRFLEPDEKSEEAAS